MTLYHHLIPQSKTRAHSNQSSLQLPEILGKNYRRRENWFNEKFSEIKAFIRKNDKVHVSENDIVSIRGESRHLENKIQIMKSIVRLVGKKY